MFTKRLVTVLIAVMFINSCLSGGWFSNRYDALNENQKFVGLIKEVEAHLQAHPPLNEFRNALFANPKQLIKALKKGDCDDEIIDWLEDNKDFGYTLLTFKMIEEAMQLPGGDLDHMYRAVAIWIKERPQTDAERSAHESLRKVYSATGPFLVYEFMRDLDLFSEWTEKTMEIMMKQQAPGK